MASVSKMRKLVYQYIDKLDDILNKNKNTYYSIIQMKSADVRDNTYIDFDKKKSNNILNFKLVILLEYQNKKKILLKDIL